MNTKDLRDLSGEELRTKAGELREELLNLRFQHAARQLENTARMPEVRREIARVLTILRESEHKNA